MSSVAHLQSKFYNLVTKTALGLAFREGAVYAWTWPFAGLSLVILGACWAVMV